MKQRTAREGQTETGRLEAFSDGVFAVAITLLALGLGVPSVKDAHDAASLAGLHGLAAALLRQWPSYLAYALSFLNVLVMWVNHHALFRIIKRTDHWFLLMNGFLLLLVTVFPFATLLLAAYVGGTVDDDRKAAVFTYALLSLLLALVFNQLWRYAARGKLLLDADANPRHVQDITRQYSLGPPLFLVAVLAALFNATISIVIFAALSLFFALPSSLTNLKADR